MDKALASCAGGTGLTPAVDTVASCNVQMNLSLLGGRIETGTIKYA